MATGRLSRTNRRTGTDPTRAEEQPGVAEARLTPDTYNKTLTDKSSFSLILDSGRRDAIQWIAFKDKVLIGTSAGEWTASGVGTKPITPFDYELKPRTVWGSKDMQPLVLHDSVMFVDRVGKKVRSMTYNGRDDKYVSPDIMVLAEHLTNNKAITTMAYQANPESIIWMTMDDGTLVSCTYDPDQEVIAWATHTIGGTDVVVESVTVIPGSAEDEVWIGVARTIDGGTVRYVERKNPQVWGADQEDCFFVDSGITYDSTATTAISGLTHLEGESVSVLGDGAVIASETVASGAITIDESASVVQAGLPYTYTLKPMRLDGGLGRTSKGSLKKIAEIVISFYKTLNAKYSDGTDERDIDFRTTTAYTTAQPLYTGDRVVVGDGGFEVEGKFEVTGNAPLPCAVRALVLRTDVTGR